MIGYDELYDYLRREKVSDKLQPIPKDFVQQFSDFMVDTRKKFSNADIFSYDLIREKKQYENAMAIFKELMLRRKKKILDLVFVAAETGVMKRDFTDLLSFEKDLFERFVLAVDDADKNLNNLLNGKSEKMGNKIVVAKEEIEEFVDMSGEIIGPFRKGDIANLERQVAEVLVSTGKAVFVENGTS